MAEVFAGFGAGLLVLGLAPVATLLLVRPEGLLLREAARLAPGVAGLLTGLARDSGVPRLVRLRLWLLLAYLAMPFDLGPDFAPALGLADDAVIVAVAMSATLRRVGFDAVERHWPDSRESFAVLRRFAPSAGAV
ncbi:DUF1232 domain-containing protein [Saccharopolyspora erythraea]|uniref:YkvA family protein n=1 Tax=Saccharopolyspora erythraea TaxID=1836 RepID=UPI001BAA32ED|nr:DUF1232 domain-containing protein [Saccharopolyspora erythraea]QUH00040.1 DUF1232 domain-containing protein [Saccharopolyspora erythraea]